MPPRLERFFALDVIRHQEWHHTSAARHYASVNEQWTSFARERLIHGVLTQWATWRLRFLPARANVELAGPVSIAKDTAVGWSLHWVYPLHFIGVFQASFCLCIPGTFANDWVTWTLLLRRQTKKSLVIPPDRQLARMQRLRHALKCNIGFIVLLMIWILWTDLQPLLRTGSSLAPVGVHLQAWLASLAAAVIPIVWLTCREQYRLTKSVGITALLFVPVVNILLLLWQLGATEQWLKDRTPELPQADPS